MALAANDQRPDPNVLPEVVQKEEAKQQRGKLKIFLGLAPGVGKTYAMLESGHQSLLEGVDQQMQASDSIDVHVIQGDGPHHPEPTRSIRPKLHSWPNQYGIATALVLVAVLISYVLINTSLLPELDYHGVGVIFLFVVIVPANFLGRGPVLFAAALTALLWDYLFIPPRFTLYILTLQDALTLVLYFGIALIAGNLNARVGGQERVAQLRNSFTCLSQTCPSRYGYRKRVVEAVFHLTMRHPSR